MKYYFTNLKCLSFLFILFFSLHVAAQNNIGIGTNTPDGSAKVDITATDKGLLIPRVSLTNVTTGAPITSPANGLMVWNTNASVTGGYGIGFYYWGGSSWTKVATGNALAATLSNGTIWIGNASNVPTEQTISSDVTISNTGVATIQDNSVDGTDIQITANATGDLMMYNGTDWVVLASGTSGYVLTGNGSGVAPSYQDPNTLITKRDVITPSGGAVDFVTSGTSQVVGAANLSIDVKTNTQTQKGIVSAPGASANKDVWGTDASGNPAWRDATNMNNVQNGINLNTSAPNATATDPYIELGGSLVRPTTITTPTTNNLTITNSGTANTIINLTSTGDFDVQDNGTSALFVRDDANVGIGTNAPAYKLSVNGTIEAVDFGSAGSQNIRVGDDAYLTDIDQVHTVGIYSTSDAAQGILRLGNGSNSIRSSPTTQTGSFFQAVNMDFDDLDNSTKGIVIEGGDSESGGFFANGNTAAIWSPGDGIGGILSVYDEDNMSAGSTSATIVPAMRISGSGSMVIGASAPANSAKLDVSSTTQGFVPPRMTTAQRNAIASPIAGLMVFNSTTGCLSFYNGTTWIDLCGGGCVATPGSQTFNYTGSVQTFTVPACVTTITVDIRGAQGGYGYPAIHVGGNGGRWQGTLTVTPGQVLNIYVGGVGGNGSALTAGAGGYNGGAISGIYSGSYAGGGGGGASDIRVSPYALANRIAVAGGGGGGGFNYGTTNFDRGGHGGGTTGESGWAGNVVGGTGAGTGGSQVAGGIGGTYSGWCTATNGSLGLGGAGGTCTNGGGGGGGGYYGGGGATWAGGGGGSSFPTSGTHTQGFQSGNGQVIISW